MGLIENNLPSDSQPWARDIENRLEAAELLIANEEINNAARDEQLQTGIDAVSEALVQVKTSTESQHAAYYWDAIGSLWSRPVVLTFSKPSWANTATVSSMVYVEGVSSYTGGTVYPLAGNCGVFVDGNLSTLTTYDWNYSSGNPLVVENTKYFSATASAANPSVYSNTSLSDVTTLKVDADSLNVWAACAKTLTNEIPPQDYSDWTAEQKDRWNVGISAYTTFSVEILCTVTWTAQ